MTIKNVFSVTLGVMLLIFSSLSLAASVISLSEGDSQEIRLSSDMASVFIADPEVADYQVIDSKKLVVFAKKKGHTSLRVFDSQGKTLRSHSIDVNTNYTDVQRQISVSYPHADVVLSNIGDKIVLSGTVSSEQESDGVYRLVGELVGITAKT
ncbi:MAG: pilus assembly protein N-terminal domain-containing protein, partial [Pseudomonadales bacterium]|nr:pilus assembly protein N-terminal domain-containing protein [Pseudomonadales bacterium]